MLQGNAGLGFRVISGLRFELGGWLDSQDIFGIDAGGLGQERRVNHFAAASDNTGTPLLALPYFSQTPKNVGERAQVISNPKKQAGEIDVAASLEHWNTEINGVFCVFRRPGLEIVLLAGTRYEDLLENLSSRARSLTIATNTTKILNDHFTTRNQFFGSQLGGAVHWQRDVVFLDVAGKIAVGSTHQILDIQGDSSQTGPKGGSFPGGLYAQPSNIGRTGANPFSVIPSLEAKLGYQLTPRLRAFIGYDILYWNHILRPGEQIDRNINLTQSPLLGAGVLSGPATPVRLLDRAVFWAQDVNFGFEFRF